jgi:hypothetical protein
MGNRGTVQLIVNNILSGLDQAVHGANKLHGWGQNAFPDSRLLTVRGFDPVTQQFKYTVNPQFGSTAVFRNTFRQPFSLTLDARMDVGPDRETQFLDGLLTPRRADGVKVFSEQQIKQRIMRGFNPVDQMIFIKDSLKLTDSQIDSMKVLSQRFMLVRDSVATAVAKFLVSRDGDYRGAEVRDRWHTAGIATYTVFVHTFQTIMTILTPEQLERGNKLPQTAGMFRQIATIKDTDLPWMFRSPLPSLP